MPASPAWGGKRVVPGLRPSSVCFVAGESDSKFEELLGLERKLLSEWKGSEVDIEVTRWHLAQ